MGLANLFWMPFALCFGKRPVVFFAMTMYLGGTIWSSVAPDYKSLLGSRVFASFGMLIIPYQITHTDCSKGMVQLNPWALASLQTSFSSATTLLLWPSTPCACQRGLLLAHSLLAISCWPGDGAGFSSSAPFWQLSI